MDPSTQPDDVTAKDSHRPLSKSLRRDKKDQKWEAHKSEIYSLYIEENNTLPETMRVIEKKHGFTASLRKWKDKVKKDWHFEKNFASKDMLVLIAKAEKRERDEGKETVFWHAGSKINPERIENFKKRKIASDGDAISPSADTPANFTYNTPVAESGSDSDSSGNTNCSKTPSIIGTDQFSDDLGSSVNLNNSGAVASQLDGEDWVNIASGGETDESSFYVGATASSTQTSLEIESQSTNVPSQSTPSPEPPDSANPLQVNTNYAAFPTVPDSDEEARINSVIWKGYRKKEDEKMPESELPPSNSPASPRSIRSIALQNLSRLADTHVSQNRLADAASTYYKVIAGYEKADGDFAAPLLAAARSLTKVLKIQGAYEEAEAVLIYAFGLCLKKIRSNSLFDMAYLRNPWQVCLIDVIDSLEEIYREIPSQEVSANLAGLRKSLKFLNGGLLSPQFPHVWFAMVKLASAYSAQQKLALAELLFAHSIPNLQVLDDILYGTKKTNGFLAYSLHLQRQRDWAKSAHMLMLALENVIQMGDQGTIPKEDYEPLIEHLNVRWNELQQELRAQNIDEEVVKPMKDLIESKRPQLDHQQQSLDVALNEMSTLEITGGAPFRRLPTLTEVSEKDGVSSMSSKSYKYGVTYSVSSIAGVSDSVFMVP